MSGRIAEAVGRWSRVLSAGGVPLEFPVHPIQETSRRPTAALDRNLAYRGLVEVLHRYPLDGVVLTTGCDETTPASLMAAATVDLPAVVLSGGPMLSGWSDGARTGSGTIVWRAREMLAAGELDEAELVELVASSAPSPGHCNTMSTASMMNTLADVLGMSLPGCAAIPAPHPTEGGWPSCGLASIMWAAGYYVLVGELPGLAGSERAKTRASRVLNGLRRLDHAVVERIVPDGLLLTVQAVFRP